MIEGVDYSFSRPDPARLAAAGKRFACRYLSYTPGKNITGSEVDRLHAAGLAVVLNWEATAGGWRGGAAAGRTHASEALRLANNLGAPNSAAIYFSIDQDTTPGDYPTVAAYLNAAAAVIGRGRLGAYGEYDLIRYLFDRKTITWGWQTYAWSHGTWEPRAHIQQYRNGQTVAGGEVDLDRATAATFGQWGETDMITKDELTKLMQYDDAVASPTGWPNPDNPGLSLQTLLRDQWTRLDTTLREVRALRAKVGAPPTLVIDPEQLRTALLDPIVLEAIGKATAGHIAALRFEADDTTAAIPAPRPATP